MTKPNPLNIKRRKNHRSIGWPHHRQIRNQRHPQLIIPANTTTLLSTPTVWSAYLSLNKKRLLSDRAYLLIASTTVAFSWSHWDSATALKNPIFRLAADTRSTPSRIVSASEISEAFRLSDMSYRERERERERESYMGRFVWFKRICIRGLLRW